MLRPSPRHAARGPAPNAPCNRDPRGVTSNARGSSACRRAGDPPAALTSLDGKTYGASRPAAGRRILSEQERYYVQVTYSNDFYGREGWLTQLVFLEREQAERMAAEYGRATLFAEGRDVTEETVTLTRVITASELLDQEGEEALRIAEAATQIQLQQQLQKAARGPLPETERSRLQNQIRRFRFAAADMRQASMAARTLTSEHVNEDLCRALETAIAVCYARPFTRDSDRKRLDDKWAPEETPLLHKALLALRHQVYAHTDPNTEARQLIDLSEFFGESGHGHTEAWLPLNRDVLPTIVWMCDAQAERFIREAQELEEELAE